jgi:2-keto-4-pentenoate hydratase/2-oxohepta-3-ene-1,7-dioic acid hydratase in catechol pathway
VRYARLRRGSDILWARLEEGRAELLTAPPWEGAARSVSSSAYAETDLACPVVPTKIVCVGRNYAAHAKELGNETPKEPLLFLKPPSSLIGPGEAIMLPPDSARVEHEAELGVVIGKFARNVREEDAIRHVFGYTCLCDVTARDLQRRDGQWTRAKGFDTFCPVGPWIETEATPAALRIACSVNGQVRQDGLTSQMIFDVPALVAYISRIMTLLPGDLIATGTPEGVGPLLDADAVEVEIRGADSNVGVGQLRVHVRATL